MKRYILLLIVAVLLLNTNFADALVIIEDGYFGALTLENDDTLLMTGGGGDSLTLLDDSSAIIQGTSPLLEGFGGIWEIDQGGYSHLIFEGGELNKLDMHSYATAILSGGLINIIENQQFAWIQEGDPPVWVPNPHITMVCDVDSIFHNTGTNILTGDWLDGSAFSIQLVNVDGYSPAIENILFIPEPATLLLIALGAALIRRR